VAGHGISAALFMTTVRALLRSRITQPGSLAEVICHVNRLLCMDTADSGDFMTLFLALVEPRTGVIRWIRAGHAPGILYDRTADRFEELSGRGMALGFDGSCPYDEYTYSGWNGDKVLFLGTDGIWEAENPQGEMYGMERLKVAIRENADCSSREIIDAVMASVIAFRETVPQEDDITVVVAKAIGRQGQATSNV
jgi:sigma-B regulation protein RsbU (phosphoserine phosphatase)